MNFNKLLNDLDNYEDSLYKEIKNICIKVPGKKKRYTIYNCKPNIPCYMQCGNMGKYGICIRSHNYYDYDYYYYYGPPRNLFCSGKCINEFYKNPINRCHVCNTQFDYHNSKLDTNGRYICANKDEESIDYLESRKKYTKYTNNPYTIASCYDDKLLKDEHCIFCDKLYNEQNKKYKFLYSTLSEYSPCDKKQCSNCSNPKRRKWCKNKSETYYYTCSTCYGKMRYCPNNNSQCNICDKYFEDVSQKACTTDIFNQLILTCKECSEVLKVIKKLKSTLTSY